MVLAIIIVICGLAYLAGCCQFGMVRDALMRVGDAPDSLVIRGDLWLVAARYRNFFGINLASIASLVAAAGVGARLARPPSDRALRSRRFFLPLLFAVSYVMMVNDAVINSDVIAMDHLASGLVCYDEDGWAGPILALLATPFAIILFVFSLFAATGVGNISAAAFKRVNLFVGLIASLFLLMSGYGLALHIFRPSFYDGTSFHSVTGLGSFALCGLSCLLIVGGLAARSAVKLDNRPSENR